MRSQEADTEYLYTLRGARHQHDMFCQNSAILKQCVWQLNIIYLNEKETMDDGC